MKGLAIVLLLINLLLVLWQYNRHVETITRDALTTEPIPADTPQLVLLSELDELPAEKQAAPEPVAPVLQYSESHDHVTASDQCLDIGPFSDENTRDKFRDWVRDYIAVLNIRVEQGDKQQFFWIYLEPTSADEARQNLDDLISRGVTDYLLIRRGNLENAISLGLFSSQDSVNRRLAELSEKGYQPVVVPVFRGNDQYWFTAQLAEDYADGLDLPESLLGDAKSKPIDCDAI